MATETTTLRVPVELRNEIARLADQRSTSMAELVAHAVERLSRDDWWTSVNDSLDSWDEPMVASYQAESTGLAMATQDGLKS